MIPKPTKNAKNMNNPNFGFGTSQSDPSIKKFTVDDHIMANMIEILNDPKKVERCFTRWIHLKLCI